VVIDAETHEIVDANPLALQLIGVPKEQVVGKVCHEFICPAERGKCPISDLGQSVDQSERVLIRAGSKRVPIIKTVTSTTLQGRAFLVESFLDITARKKAEEALEKLNKDLESAVRELRRTNKELQQFAYIAAHDLKTPLRAIGVLAHWISTDYADKFDEQGRQQVKLLVERAERMSKLVDSLLEYSRTGQLSRKQEQVDLNTVLSEVIAVTDPPENIEITVENNLPTVVCDRTRMTQVFGNLLSNAVKYTDKPKGLIRVGCAEDGGFWRFSVADNGPGIEQKYFEKIFKIFQTLSPRDGTGGTGIGLSIVKKIVELNSGRVWLESKPGEGSTFFFTLPAQMAVQNAERHDAVAVG
jgi:two-component system sensor kinase FixL